MMFFPQLFPIGDDTDSTFSSFCSACIPSTSFQDPTHVERGGEINSASLCHDKAQLLSCLSPSPSLTFWKIFRKPRHGLSCEGFFPSFTDNNIVSVHTHTQKDYQLALILFHICKYEKLDLPWVGLLSITVGEIGTHTHFRLLN